jgi:hypothetical protein
MPSSYTSRLRLVLPVTGELTGSWGDVVNAGLTQLVEDALSGTASISMSDANLTLSTANEAPDQARNMFITLNGGALSAQRDVICPAVSKLYFVTNNTTGGQSIRFKTPSGTGTVIPPGQRAALYCDGVNVVVAGGSEFGLAVVNAVDAAAARAAIGAASLAQLYPVGSIYINATNDTNPATLLGVGTWVAFGAGRVLVGFNAGDALFNAAEKTGGSKDAIVVSHSHSLTDPGHSHTTTLGIDQSSGLGFQKYFPGIGQNIQSSSSTTGISVNSTGSSGANANLQPFITVYMWKRTA